MATAETLLRRVQSVEKPKQKSALARFAYLGRRFMSQRDGIPWWDAGR